MYYWRGTVCVQGGPGVADTNGGTSFSVTDGPGGPFIPETDGPGGPLTRGAVSSMTRLP